MGIFDVYHGRQSWQQFLEEQPAACNPEQRRGQFEPSASSPAPGSLSVRLRLRAPDYRLAMESGLGALGKTHDSRVTHDLETIELPEQKLAAGVSGLNADFNLLFGDFVWQCEMQQEALTSMLEEVRLAEFEREARAYRARAERAYVNGWFEEALADFLEAEKRNYPDFVVLRSAAQIYLYHLVNLPEALNYFGKAAKYARPVDPRQAAEAHYFAGIVCVLLRNLSEASSHLRAAAELDPELHEASYEHACVAALMGDHEEAIRHLEPAIQGDPRYYERAKRDSAFQRMRQPVRELLAHLMEPIREKVTEAQRNSEWLKGYVIAAQEQERIQRIFENVKRQMAGVRTYDSGLRFLQTLSEVQSELRGLFDQFNKQYEVDPRDYVRSIAFSPDGMWLASGFLHGGLKLWEVETGLPAHALAGHLASVTCVVFSPDSEWLASCSRDKTVKLWDVASGSKIRTLKGHDAEVRAVAFSPDGQWLASGSHDRTVRIWRVVTGREVQALEGHSHQVTSAVFSPDGTILASGSADKTIRLWEMASGQTIRVIAGGMKGIASLAFNPCGLTIASGDEFGGVCIWNVEKGELVRSLKGFRNSVTSLAFSHDGRLLGAGSLGQRITVWKLETGSVVKDLRLPDISYNSVAFSPRGEWMALGSRDLQLWLKAVLTEEQHAAVKEGERRASEQRRNERENLMTYLDHSAVGEEDYL